jgi:hypothetical protein
MDNYQFNLAVSYLNIADTGKLSNFWIGLTDVAIDGTFIWNGSNTAATYFKWDSNQPGL